MGGIERIEEVFDEFGQDPVEPWNNMYFTVGGWFRATKWNQWWGRSIKGEILEDPSFKVVIIYDILINK